MTGNPFAPKMTGLVLRPSTISFTCKWKKKPWNALVEETGLTPRVTIDSRLGSFEKGCERAKVPCRRLIITKRLSGDDILQALREVHAFTKRPISSRDIAVTRKIKRDTIVKRFGSLAMTLVRSATTGAGAVLSVYRRAGKLRTGSF